MLRIKQSYPGAKVAGYEPSPNNFSELQRNAELNGWQNVELHQKGVGGSTRKEKLYLHPSNIGGNSIFQNQAGSSHAVDIELVDIHELIPPRAICHLLKLDCEGAEYEILMALDEAVAARIEVILFEPTPSLYDIHELADHLRELGYTVGKNRGLYMAVQSSRATTASKLRAPPERASPAR